MRTRSRQQQLRRALSRKSAVPSLPENSLGDSEGEARTLLTPTRIHSPDKLSPSRGQDQIEENSMDIAPPSLALQDASRTPRAQKTEESYPGHVRITHFDFSKYKPSTPGSESHPIKIEEDSPDGSPFTVLPTGLGGLSATGISIITSPKAATGFLHCFLAAEKYWLRSCDHDMDPDIKFWKKLLAQFNANRLDYQIDTWETARLMASTLCSQSYKMHFQQRPASADDGIPCLLSAIEDCRRMSKQRRWGQRRGCESSKTPSDDAATEEEDAQKSPLSRKPKTLEDHRKLMQALRKSSICDHPYLRPIQLPRHTTDADDDASSRVPVVRFAALALLWAFAVAHLSLLAETPTGVICPGGWCAERFVPLAQLAAVFLDAIIISQISGLRRSDRDRTGRVWYFLGSALLTSVAILSFTAVWSYLYQVDSTVNIFLTTLELRDIVIDSVFTTLAVVFGVCLLGSFHANLMSLVTTGTTVSTLVLSTLLNSTLRVIWTGPPFSVYREHTLSLGRYYIYALAVFLTVFLSASLFDSQESLVSSLRHVMVAGRIESDNWIASAAKSTSIESATKEYRRRYGLPPPPNFDKWYEFATSVNSPIIDAFDQINSDLLPFWALTPASLREKTTHLLEHPSLSIGGLLIQDGQISISPHIHGTHRWMVDVIDEMVKPFSQWLPDMQLAFNLDDECRVSIPATDMTDFKNMAYAARSRLQSKQGLVSFSQTSSPPWDKGFLDNDDSIWERRSDSFRALSKSPIFSQLVASTCPTDAPANQVRWWNRKIKCKECPLPHTENGFVSNWTLSADLCHQPDLAHLHGFLTSPSAMAASQSLFPVFSQARVGGFVDILYPSPWSFNEKAHYEKEKDVPWERKLESVYWRGASSDGYAIRGSWQMFLRARFVHLASTIRRTIMRDGVLRLIKRSQPVPSTNIAVSTPTPDRGLQGSDASNGQITVNVTFVGSFSRCDEPDCTAEHVTFYGSPSAEPPVAHDFQENWQHRHLVDLDGAGFSGRFLPFVRSASLPYRAALFRTWWEERIHPWKHYVPLDLRLDDFWPALKYFSGVGTRDAHEIADAGRQWVQKALRKEDMQVYMFRLLLEWGRMIDDRREDIGFSLDT
ncbi:hypothetical protein GQX73_g6868 [Xylaria multiplex]|uniref:Glycosyl transferase CAP10 domain-containing protein n=1 Tax=Xylaria multiplex TaxID=323545 RepID=A0A7C8IYG6_9PEZI|nr:hypothetical protein GQX73_g6868 [Xylaria multiplex]